jgi:hypothetical protein
VVNRELEVDSDKKITGVRLRMRIGMGMGIKIRKLSQRKKIG